MTTPNPGPNPNEDDFIAFYRAHIDAVDHYVRRRYGGPDHDDILVETFVAVWRRTDDLTSVANPRGWVLGIARNCIRNTVRAARRRTELLTRVAGSTLTGRAHPHGDPSEETNIDDHLRELTDTDRAIVTLVVIENFGASDAAAILGLTARQVTNRLYRIRRRLRDLPVHVPSTM